MRWQFTQLMNAACIPDAASHGTTIGTLRNDPAAPPACVSERQQQAARRSPLRQPTLVGMPGRSPAIDGLERLLAAAAGCSRLVVFTGSGVSATSGVSRGAPHACVHAPSPWLPQPPCRPPRRWHCPAWRAHGALGGLFVSTGSCVSAASGVTDLQPSTGKHACMLPSQRLPESPCRPPQRWALIGTAGAWSSPAT